MSLFHERIKFLRVEKKLTQKQMAEMVETTERAYQYYESGTREPNVETLIKISNLFSVSTDYLLGCSDDPTRR